MFQRRPALRLVLLFAAGIILAAWIPLSLACLYVITVILAIIAAILILINKWNIIAEILLQCAGHTPWYFSSDTPTLRF